MKALPINCALKPSPEKSNTEAPAVASEVSGALEIKPIPAPPSE